MSATSFEPIAVVGQACVLPGALSPAELWRAVREGRDLLTRVPPGRWRVDPELVLSRDPREVDDHTWTDRGGYVQGFEALFDPQGFRLSAGEIMALDPLVHWLLHCGRQALGQRPPTLLRRGGVIVGNLSYPSASLSRLAESVWLDEVLGERFLDGRAREICGVERPAAINRFMSGLPAQLLARALGLEQGGFALDSACASSLYAIKLACDRLHDRRADLVLAGGVNRADDLFIHIGFCALQAMSRRGESWPFHRDADGLVPAEGAALVALRRLEDAVADGDPILGVIRAVGLANDGRGRGLLAPCPLGQERAMRAAYRESGLEPRDVSLLECHATGTPVGDVVEVQSVARVFAGTDGVAVGSLKSNLGHLITASGAAGLIKVLAAMDEGTLPPTINAERPLTELEGSPLRLVREARPWQVRSGPRRAGINNFGFGGNNAHLIVEQHEPKASPRRRDRPAAVPRPEIAVVALQVLAADGEQRAEVVPWLFTGETRQLSARAVELPLTGLRFPPKDLDETLAQQLTVLRAALLALEELGPLPTERTGVLIGMQCDADVARYGARLRMPQWTRAFGAALGRELGADWLARAREGVGFLRRAAGVVGAMPNIPANRLSSQLDLGGPAFTVSAEELSGLVCLELAVRALQSGELDAALVGAVDLCCEPVHAAAARDALEPALPGEGRSVPGDAAALLVLKRLDDARRDGDRVYAVLGGEREGHVLLRVGPGGGERLSLTPQLGHAHAASGLLHLCAAVLACHHRASPGGAGRPPVPWWPGDGEPRGAEVQVTALGGAEARVTVRADEERPAAPLLLGPAPRVRRFAGADRADLLARLERGEESVDGPARLAVVASDKDAQAARLEEARALLRGEAPGALEGVYYSERPVSGELAFVFTGPAGAHAGMGRELVLGLPELLARLHGRCRCVEQTGAWIYAADPPPRPDPHQKLWGSSYLSQLHTELSRGLLGLGPRAAIGFCSGETNALFALGAWTDLDTFFPELLEAGVFSRQIGGELAVPHRAWGLGPDEPARWESWRVLAEEARVLEALEGEPRCHLTIVSAPGDLVIGGEPEACRRVAERVGRSRAYPLGYDVAIHCPEMEVYAGPWRELHHRPTTPVPGVRFYSVATASCYEASADAAADALTGMALGRVDFPRLIRQAHDDGVRVFLEHGPRDGCTKWIGRILGDRPHLAVALDRVGRGSLEQAVHAAAELWAAGLEPDIDALHAALDAADRPLRFKGPTRRYPAHPAPVELPPIPAFAEDEVEVMEPAPELPDVGVGAGHVRHGATRLGSESVEGRLAGSVWHVPGHLAITRAHQAFLSQQAQVHRSFLDFRQRSLARLTEALQIHGASISTPERALGHGSAGAAPVDQDARALPWPSARNRAALSAPPPSSATAARDARTPPTPALPSSVPTSRKLPPDWRPVGPRFDRAQLEVLASGKISSVLGPLFEGQDRFERQVRLPEPPLLLVDRVVGIAGEPGSMGKGTIWTETDVTPDAWYLHDGYMPSGIVVESGQSDLLLISWLGIDALNRGERIYRLLGCELTNHGTLPRPGDTLRYAIHVDGHARAGAVRLFFFHYDCYVGDELRLRVRNAQAGFFTDAELEDSGGVLWDAAEAEHRPDGRVDPPAVRCTRRRFSAARVRAFSEGQTLECFGPGFERTLTHTRTPHIQGGKMLLLEEVAELDPTGGPWGRGYLRVENAIHPDDWFMQGHFKNDPCMPGTLMCEGCLQAMAFYLAAMGFTVDRDGWRFEPVPDETYKLQCRGQVTPSSRHLTYEVFVEELIDGPQPTIFADILGTSDGLKIFHGRRMGLRLVPDWPMTSMDLASLVPREELERPVAQNDEGFRFDYRSLLACAWGRPSEAFGSMAEMFDGTRHIARLPGPPYHFMSRVTRIEGQMGSMKPGASIELEYDIPPGAWYFGENGAPLMPFCVLLEAVLQPCGWLAVYIGCPGSSRVDVCFRNLDGTGTVHRTLPPDAGTLRTRTTLKSISRMGDIILVSFDVECRAGDELVYSLETGFGFFPAAALASQVGLPVSEEQRARLEAPGNVSVDLTDREGNPRYFAGALRLPGPMLLMLDRLSGYWPEGGRAGLGRLRAEKDVHPGQWFFKAHFFQDPVQPGSLGLEAMIQLLQLYMIHEGLGESIPEPCFEPIALGRPFTWKYRGQVTPERQRVTVELEILERGRDGQGAYAVAESSLWVDGLRIYHTENLALRVVPGQVGHGARSGTGDTFVLDPETDTWLQDHRPNWTLPTLPLMSMADLLAGAASREAPGLEVIELRDLELSGWLVLDGPRRLRTEIESVDRVDGRVVVQARLEAWREAARAELSRFEPVARATVVLAADYPGGPGPLEPLGPTEVAPDPYASGALFHGPAFQLLRRLEVGARGSTALLDAGAPRSHPGAPGAVPFGRLNQALLDAAVHGILHDELERWSGSVPAKHIAYPYRLARASFHGPPPGAGEVRCETRLVGLEGGRFARFRIQLLVGERPWAELDLVEVLIPMGPHADDRQKRIDFRDGRFVEGAGLSRFVEGETRLTDDEVRARDWLRGSVAHAYRVAGTEPERVTRELAVKDHVSQRARVHPATVAVEGDVARAAALPLTCFPVRTSRVDDEVRVVDAGEPHLDLEALRAFGRRAFGLGPWLGEDLSLGLCRRFLARLELDDPAAMEPIAGRGVLFLGNHQVQIESMIFPMVVTAALGRHIVTVAKEEHRTGWVGPLSSFTYRYPGVDYPRVIVYFDQRRPAEMFAVLEELRRELAGEGHSVFVHVEGELGLACRRPVERLSSVFVDLSRELELPIVPVRLAGGLPLEPLDAPLDFPLGFTRQSYHLGRPLLPEELAHLAYADRRQAVLEAINRTGPPLAGEEPGPADPIFAARVQALQAERGLDQVRAVVRAILEELPDPSEQTARLLEALRSGDLERLGDDEQGRWLQGAARWLAG